MNKTEYLLTKLSEECAEVIQRCTKAQTFGLTEVQPGQELNNEERLLQEVTDVQMIIDLFAALRKKAKDSIVHSWDLIEYVKLKDAKIKKYAELSIARGHLVLEEGETF